MKAIKLSIVLAWLGVCSSLFAQPTCIERGINWYSDTVVWNACLEPITSNKLLTEFDEYIRRNQWTIIGDRLKAKINADGILTTWSKRPIQVRLCQMIDSCLKDIRQDTPIRVGYFRLQQDLASRDFYFGQVTNDNSLETYFNRSNTTHAQWIRLQIWTKALHEVLIQPDSGNLQMQLQAIRSGKIRYENYLYKGLYQYPWEALINGWLFSSQFDNNGPSRDQIPLLHPSMVFQINVKELKNIVKNPIANQALSVDLLGYIRYNKDFKGYAGVSGTANFYPGLGMGFGGKIFINGFNLGASWHDLDQDGKLDGPLMIQASVNLFNFLQKNSKAVSKLAELKTELTK
jgi:hypothetical protein